MQKQIESYIDAHRDEIVEQWKSLVNIEGKADELEQMNLIADHLYNIFTEAGVECELRQPHPEGPKTLVGVIGKERPGQPVCFGGHYDTVFKKGTFGDEPFRIDEEGKAHGPGCLDMKGGIIITLYVIKALEAAGYNERPIRIVFCGDEEGGPYHAVTATPSIQEMATGCVCAFNMETGPVNNDLCIGRKTPMTGSFTVTGVSAHSGNNFEVGRNAVAEAAHKIVEIEALTDMEKGTHMNVAIIKGGTVWNSIPDHCEVQFSGRFASNAEMDRVKAAIAEIMAHTHIEGTSTEYTLNSFGKVFEPTDASMALWALCNKVSQDNRFGEMGHVFLGGGSDAVSMAVVGTPTLCSCGVRGEWNHTDREYAVVESMFVRAKLWCAVVQRLGEFHG